MGLCVPAAGADPDVDVCLEIAASAVTSGSWAAIQESLADVLAERTALFPAPTLEASAHPGVVGAAPASMAISIDAGHAGRRAPLAFPGCLEPGFEWGARFSRSFLQAGADEMLAQAATTPGIDSRVDIEWYPAEQRLRTMLAFAGPLDIPNGRCWIDDVLSIDSATGLAVASGEQGLRTSPFAEGACGRFFGQLPDGGAGGQAVTMLPTSVGQTDGRVLRFIASRVLVTDEDITIGGSLEER
jgi:hypothetical protein